MSARDPAEHTKSVAELHVEEMAKQLATNARKMGASAVVVMVAVPDVDGGPDAVAFYCAFSGGSATCLGLAEAGRGILLKATVKP